MLKHASLALVAAAVISPAQQRATCPMEPDHLSIQLPRDGLVWLEADGSGPCDAVSPNDWVKVRSKTSELLVHADGPGGSGRFWTVTVAVAEKPQTKTSRGVCFMTSTAGWRTLQRFKDSPLPWTDDLDGDGLPELIIWSSFALREDASQAEFGLIAWVYQFDSEGAFAIDWKLSRRIAGDLAAAYQAPLENAGLILALRNKAAQALASFAKGACTVPGERPR